MLSLEDSRALAGWEDSYLAEPEPRSEDDDIWNRADDEAEERWFQKLREGDL